MTFSIDHVESDLALDAGAVSGSAEAALLSGVLVELAETVILEYVPEVADFAGSLSLVLMASLNVAGLDADVERVRNEAWLAT